MNGRAAAPVSLWRTGVPLRKPYISQDSTTNFWGMILGETKRSKLSQLKSSPITFAVDSFPSVKQVNFSGRGRRAFLKGGSAIC